MDPVSFEVFDKLSIVVNEFKESFNFFKVRRYWPMFYSFDFLFIHLNISWSDLKSEEFCFLNIKLVFLNVNKEINVLKCFKYIVYVLFIFIQRFGIDQDIVEVYNHEVVKVFFQYMVDYSLKAYWYVGKS